MENSTALQVVQEVEILGKKIKMYGSIEFPYFVASDVAEWLGERDGYTVARKVSDEEKDTQIVCTLGGNQKTTIFTEDGLYEACMLSRKEIAKPLKAEIKKYLKSIRLTGGTVESGREEEFINNNFQSFSEETKLLMVKDLLKQSNEYKKKIKQLEPQAQAYSDLMTAQGYLQFLDIAALVETGRNTLLEFLRKCKVLTKQSNYNIPYGKFLKNGMFKVVTSRSENGHISSVTMVSPRGLNYIYKLMKKKDVLDEFNTTALLKKIQELEVA